MASFFSDENDVSAFLTNVSAGVFSPVEPDNSFDDFTIKKPIDDGDLTADTPVKDGVYVFFTPPATRREASSVSDATAPRTPTTEDIRKMNEESERLAWELMQQESLDAYNYQVEFMRENSAGMDPADVAALEEAMAEERGALAQVENTGEEGSLEEDDSHEWTYDRLLALGEAVGDVKTERWKLKAADIIKDFPVVEYGGSDIVKISSKYATHDVNCVVCMDDYQKGEQVRVLPCQHFFHTACADGWLESHSNCPSCKVAVVQSP